MSTYKLNLDALENMDIPEIKDGTSSKPINKKVEKEKEIEIEEVESLEDFVKNQEKEKREGEEEEEEEEEKPSENDDKSDPILQIAQWQSDLGILDFTQEEYTKAEDKEEFFKQKYIEKVQKTADESLHPVIRELNEKFREGVPLDELISSRSEQMRLESIKEDDLEEDEDLQERLVASMLQMSGWDKDEIKDEIETYKDSNKLANKAKRALTKLIDNEKSYQEELKRNAEKQRIENEKAYNAELKRINDTIMKTDSFIDGVTMTKEDKEKLYNSIVKRDKDGYNLFEKKLMENPNMQFAFAQFVLQLDGKFDKIKNAGRTESNKRLKESVDTYSDKKDKKTSIDLAVVREAMSKTKKTY